MQVGEILREKGRDVVTIASDATIADAAKRLAQRRIGALVASDASGGLLGILSERDIVRAVAEHGAAALTQTVGRHMTQVVSTCAEADTVDALMETMTNGRFRHMPVIENGRLCGIVSIGDVVKTRIAETEREAATLRGYIAAG
jgi:CBS domain-containing protein